VSGKLVVDALAERVPACRSPGRPQCDDGARFLAAARARGDRVLTIGAATSTAPRRCCWSCSRERRAERPLVALHDARHRRAGGCVRATETLDELQERCASRASSDCRRRVGLGSNLLVADDGFDGLVLKLAAELARARCARRCSRRAAGAPNAVALHRARAAGLGGFEFACAIPGLPRRACA
jgi:hypothetical protein